MVNTMETENFKETERSLEGIGFRFGSEQVRVQIPNAKQNFYRGMCKYCGTDKIEWEQGYDEIVDWLTDNNGRGLLLIGGVGLGKSVFCMRVLPVLINFYHRKLIYPYYADKINEKYSEIISKKLVCLDDIGTEGNLNDYGNKKIVFNEIVDMAEREGNFLVINTNLSTDEIGQRYGTRTLDRLKAITKVIIIKGESNRK